MRWLVLLLVGCVVVASGCVQPEVTCEQAGFEILSMKYLAASRSIQLVANNTGKKDLTLFARIEYGDGSVDNGDPEFYLSAGEGPMTFTISDVGSGIEGVSLVSSNCLDVAEHVDRDDITGIEDVPVRLEDVDTPTFTYTNDNVCRNEGKPMIMLFSDSRDYHCEWISKIYDSVVKSYGDKIAAYHWNINTGDNTLTSTTEPRISEIENFWYTKYNKDRTVPTFIFGCAFTRIGNGYEAQNDTGAEEAEFRTIIDALV